MRLHHRYNSVFKSVSGLFIITLSSDGIAVDSSGRAPDSSIVESAAERRNYNKYGSHANRNRPTRLQRGARHRILAIT